MKRALVALSLLAAVGLLAGQLWAEGGDTAPDKPKTVRKPKTARKPTLHGAHAQMAKVCALSEEQVKKILDLNAAQAKAQKEWQDANGEKYKAAEEKYKVAREAKDAEAIKKARAERDALRKEREAIRAKNQADVLAVLSDEQKAKWRTYNAVRTVKGRFRGVTLTDEQLAQVERICAEAADDLNVDDTRKRYAAYAKLAAKVEQDVLTGEQRAEVALGMIKRIFRKAKLTDEQLAKIKAAYAKHTGSVDLSDAKAKSAAMQKLYAEIRGDILTDEQREATGSRKPRPAPKPKKAPDKPADG